MNRIVLYGASGHAKVILDILERSGETRIALVDDNESIKMLSGLPVQHIAQFEFHANDSVIISIGNNAIRKRLALSLDTLFTKAIHPNALLGSRVQIGDGSAVMGGATINPDTSIGMHCIINTNASIDHDCKIGDFTHVAPNATLCGGITIGGSVLVGAGAVVLPNINIGDGAIIGAGSVITRDVPAGATVVGNPGKIINHHE